MRYSLLIPIVLIAVALGVFMYSRMPQRDPAATLPAAHSEAQNDATPKPLPATPPVPPAKLIQPTFLPPLKRDWGEPSKGFMLSLTSDKSTYGIHEKIALHAACQRTTDSWSVTQLAYAPLCATTIEIRDAKGALVTSLSNPYKESGPMRTDRVEKGLIIPEEITIGSEGTQSYFMTSFARRIGTSYTLTAKWHAHSNDAAGDVEADVRSKPLVLQIVAD